MKHFTLLLAILLGLSFTGLAYAESGKVIGSSGKWQAYSASSGEGLVCFITSEPTKLEGNYDRNNRDETRVFVTHHGKGERGVVSNVAGYRYKEGEGVKFIIDGKAYSLFSVDTRAWATEPTEDQAMIKAMKRGRVLKVEGISSRGNKTIDTYSLTGFTKAMGMIDKACS